MYHFQSTSSPNTSNMRLPWSTFLKLVAELTLLDLLIALVFYVVPGLFINSLQLDYLLDLIFRFGSAVLVFGIVFVVPVAIWKRVTNNSIHNGGAIIPPLLTVAMVFFSLNMLNIHLSHKEAIPDLSKVNKIEVYNHTYNSGMITDKLIKTITDPKKVKQVVDFTNNNLYDWQIALDGMYFGDDRTVAFVYYNSSSEVYRMDIGNGLLTKGVFTISYKNLSTDQTDPILKLIQ